MIYRICGESGSLAEILWRNWHFSFHFWFIRFRPVAKVDPATLMATLLLLWSGPARTLVRNRLSGEKLLCNQVSLGLLMLLLGGTEFVVLWAYTVTTGSTGEPQP